ncbi:isocitrate/isopropylmalate family dehydrogenase [Methylobacterium planeticum]|nr:isocitrate/isopropylmalate family dehydrogenase [Methylobacterium planeticum]
MTSRRYCVAVIPGDGIGREVVPEGVRVLEATAKRHGFTLQLDWFDLASCDYYERHGRMMPDDWKAQIGAHDAIFFGAVGMPERVPDHISLWGSLILFRREFDHYATLRPVRLMPGVPSPLVNRKPGDIDFWVVRVNTEGEYSNAGGRMFAGTEREFAMQETIMTRHGVDRILTFAFELAQSRPKKHLTSATKSNGISITMPYWDERVRAMAEHYPDVRWDQYHIDILTAHYRGRDAEGRRRAEHRDGDRQPRGGPGGGGERGRDRSGLERRARPRPTHHLPAVRRCRDLQLRAYRLPAGPAQFEADQRLHRRGQGEEAGLRSASRRAETNDTDRVRRIHRA